MKLFDFIKRNKEGKKSPLIDKFESKGNIEKADVTTKNYKNTDLFQDDSDLGYC